MIRAFPVDCIWLTLITLTSLGIGSRLLKLFKIEFPNRSFHYLFSSGMGLAVFSILTFLLGFLGALYSLVFMVALILLFLISIKESRSLLREIGARREFLPRIENKFEFALFIFIGIAILSNLIFNYAPPTQPRETMYDLALPKIYLNAHRILDLPDKQVHYYPLQIQMLYLMAMGLDSALLAKLIHFLLGILSLGMVYSIGRYFFGEKCALYSAAIFYLMPVITSLSGTANIDLGTLFYGLLAIASLLFWVQSKSTAYLYLAAFISGIVLGTKLIGLSLPLAFFIFVPYQLWVRDRKTFLEGTKKLIGAGFFILLGVSPWIFRNIYFTGNPFAPISIPLLGIQGHPDANLELLLSAQAKTAMKIGDTVKGIRNIFFGNFIYGGGPLLFTLLIPAFLDAESRKKSLLLLSLALLNYLILFFILPINHRFYETRYYIISYGIFSVLAGVGMRNILRIANRSFIKGPILGSLFFPCLLFSLLFSYKRFPLFLGRQTQEIYLREKLKFFNLFTFANQNLPVQSKVLTLGISNPDEFYWNSILVHPGWNLLQETDSLRVLQELKKSGIHYLFFYDPSYRQDPNSKGLLSKQSPLEIIRWNWREFKNNHLLELYRGTDGTLYQIM